MANLLDYLDWRGDLTWEAAPFNEVDNLILAELSFVDFKGIVPGPGEGESVPLSQAAEAFFNRYKENGEAIDMGVLVPGAIPSMLEKMAQSKRFGEMKLNCLVDWLDVEKAEQFAALTVEVDSKTLYLSFRGRRHHCRLEGRLYAGLRIGAARAEKSRAVYCLSSQTVSPPKADPGRPLQGRQSGCLWRRFCAAGCSAPNDCRLQQRRPRLP